jgi:hypothetical protein
MRAAGHQSCRARQVRVELERALADLRLNIDDIVPSRYIELNSDDEDDAGRNLITGVIVDVGYQRTKVAFSEFTWPPQLVLQQLRRALLIPRSSIEILVREGTR